MHVTYEQIFLLCLAAFCAGFVDAIVGGGGLIQTPATLVLLGGFPVVNAISTTKIPSFSGTLFAAMQYMKRVQVHWRVTVVMCVIAFFASFAGSELLAVVSNHFMKPVLLIVLFGVTIYTWLKKDFGQQEAIQIPEEREMMYAVMISAVLGFYDGFIGPGTGTFLILAFIYFLGFDFMRASAHAKLVNLSTNLGSIMLFSFKGKMVWIATIPMALCNAAGGMLGARLAISKGNRFIRVFFMIIVMATLVRLAWDILKK